MPLVHLRSLSRRVKTSDILAFLDQFSGLSGRRVGRIELQGGEAVIEVPEGWQSRVAKALDGQLLGDRRVQAWTENPADAHSGADDHFVRLARLLEMESRAEAEESMERCRRMSSAEAERMGTSLVDLVVLDEESGLGGRYLLRLIKRRGSPLPWTRLGVGSPVLLSSSASKDVNAYRGVVCERTEGYLQVALASMPDELSEQETWRLDLSSDEVAVDRQRAALNQIRLARGDRLAELRDVLLGRRQVQFHSEQAEPVLDASLNDTQQAAVRFALSARDLALRQFIVARRFSPAPPATWRWITSSSGC